MSPSHPGIKTTCSYKTEKPDSSLPELQAIHDAIKAVNDLPNVEETHIYTDSRSAVKNLKQVRRCKSANRYTHYTRCARVNVKVHWVQVHSQDPSMADHNSHHTPLLPGVPTFLPSDPRSLLMAQKSILRRDTRDLIPRVFPLLPVTFPGWRKSLRRFRDGAALMARSHWKRVRNRKADPRVLNRRAAGIERFEGVFANRFGSDLTQPLSRTAKWQPIVTRC